MRIFDLSVIQKVNVVHLHPLLFDSYGVEWTITMDIDSQMYLLKVHQAYSHATPPSTTEAKYWINLSKSSLMWLDWEMTFSIPQSHQTAYGSTDIAIKKNTYQTQI